MIKSRAGEPADEAWADWIKTTRRNAVSLPATPHLYRLGLRREWHSFAAPRSRPLVFRLPRPLRNAQRGRVEIRLIEPAGGLLERRDDPSRVELRIDPVAVRGPVIAELEVTFAGAALCGDDTEACALGAPAEPSEECWLREREGAIAPSLEVGEISAKLAAGCSNAREFLNEAWDWLLDTLRFGDVHRADLDPVDPLGGLLRSRLADCVLGSSLLVGLCRARGIPARLVTGFLIHPANVGPHSWAEVKVGAGRWIPYDFGAWCYCAGNPRDPIWGHFFRGRVDARFVAEVAPREFTGWGSAAPPAGWFRLERLDGDAIEHTLHALPDAALVRRDRMTLDVLGPI